MLETPSCTSFPGRARTSSWTRTGRSTSSSTSPPAAGTPSASTGRRSGSSTSGTADADILRNPRQLSASLRLTLWLTQKLGIKLRNVIGHNESLTSPFHKELYPGWRCQTHGDWTYADMTIYRGKLRSLARRYGINMGALPKQGHTDC